VAIESAARADGGDWPPAREQGDSPMDLLLAREIRRRSWSKAQVSIGFAQS